MEDIVFVKGLDGGNSPAAAQPTAGQTLDVRYTYPRPTAGSNELDYEPSKRKSWTRGFFVWFNSLVNIETTSDKEKMLILQHHETWLLHHHHDYTSPTMPLRPTTFPRYLHHYHFRGHHASIAVLQLPHAIPNGASSDRHRAFSTSAADAITSVFDTTQSLILQLQTATSLPWLFAIPLVAVIARTVVTLPFSLYGHRQTRTRLGLSPLLHAWAAVHRRQVAKAVHPADPATPAELVGRKIYDTPQKWQREVLLRTARKRRQLYRQFGCQAWKSYVGLVQIPVWILASVSVRRLAGVGHWWTVTPGDASAAGSDAEVDTLAAASTDADASVPVGSASGMDEITAAVRAQMQHGGIDGWFPDLLQPDPMFILPIVFSLTVFTNIASVQASAQNVTGWRKGLRNGLMAMSILILPVTLNAPAILLLYWSTSSTYSLLQNAILGRLLPMPRTVKPVDRPRVLGHVNKAA
ncbi:hypothetical protein Dda_5801 [Drechslerella dactyloides]|uniref:Uncharacterized protein n=1 Tax=Drechslerella dactyloides TaxID=74499 RepID=A0AAD6IUZ1_DREDA|nr:hypothetical protein Dda_5801 [Drechslerella dactyloides]